MPLLVALHAASWPALHRTDATARSFEFDAIVSATAATLAAIAQLGLDARADAPSLASSVDPLGRPDDQEAW